MDNFVSQLDSHGCNPKQTSDGWQAKCPAHEDRNPSLSVREGNDRRILVKCHAGCDSGAVVAALGIKLADLFEKKKEGAVQSPSGGSGGPGKIVATYDYCDEKAQLLYQVTRHDPKTFRQRRRNPDSPNGWSWGMHGVRRVLYRLPAIIENIKRGLPVFVCEGEKDVDAMVESGLQATCNTGGAGKWDGSYSESLRGADVAIIADKDMPGREHASKVASALVGVAKSVRVLEVPNVNGTPCKDAADFFAAGGKATDLIGLADSTPEWVCKDADPAPKHGAQYEDSQDGRELPDGSDAQRANRFVGRFRELLRFIPEWERWLVFEGGRWKSRDDGGLIRLSCELASEILSKASLSDGDQRQVREEIERATKEASSYASANRVRSMSLFARADGRVIARPEDLDSDPWLIGAPNAVLNLRTGEVLPHSPARLVTRFIGCDLDPKATAPKWDEFLRRVLPDEDVRTYVQKAAGYSLTGQTSEHHFIFLFGVGANGKSTFLETLFALFGDYAGRAAETLLYAQDRGATPPDVIAEIAGVRFLVGSETREGARLNEGAIKDVTGGDTLRGARKYEHGFKFRPVSKLWMCGNHRPAIQGSDDGIWRRVRLIDFPVQIPPEERDPDLPNKLRAELPGIANWLAEGCRLWQRDGLQPPKSVQASVSGYRDDEDVIGQFIAERTEEFGPASCSHQDVYRAYVGWSEAGGMKHSVTSRMLSRRLRDRGWMEGKNSGQLIWRGVRIRG